MADDKIRVLIVDDIAETRENIRKLLQFEPDVDVVGAAQTGAEGIQLAGDENPDVVLMDINMPDMDGIAATEAIRKKYPAIQIVILSVQNDANYMRRAMLAGARDFLTKPPDVDELTAAIRRAGEMSQAEKSKSAVAAAMMPQMVARATGSLVIPSIAQGKIISMYAPKGGAGSTTLVSNLAVALHSEETPVAVVDGNLQFGDLSFFFNQQGKNSIVDLATSSEELDIEIINEVIIEHPDSGVKILSAPMRPEHAESVTGEQFAMVLKFLRQMFTYVLVDMASLLTEITLATIDVSDVLILLTTQDIPSIKNARLFLDLVNALGLETDRILMVMNRYDKRRSNITPEKVSENFKQEFASVIPIDEKLVVPAMDRGIPFMLQNKSHPVSRSILLLAEKTRRKIAELEQLEAEPV